jgi:uncharacterized protein with HEPN domain
MRSEREQLIDILEAIERIEKFAMIECSYNPEQPD